MGMTKSLQERILARANLDAPQTRFVLVRYGNVLASRGSVIPLFHDQIRNGGPVTITDPRMTRFLLSLEEAVDIILVAMREARRGETYIPRAPSAKIVDVATALIENRPIETVISGVRPGEKLHELLISEEECHRAVRRDGYYAIGPILPELQSRDRDSELLGRPYSSADDVMTPAQTHELLVRRGLMIDHDLQLEGEFLR
jgi:FlaA1/EpsC-like NDP-sugar epimerase